VKDFKEYLVNLSKNIEDLENVEVEDTETEVSLGAKNNRIVVGEEEDKFDLD